MKTSLRKKLHDKIRTDGRMSYGTMCEYTVQEGYKVNTAERRLRELMEDNLVFAEWATSKRNTRYISAYVATAPLQRTIREIVVRDGRAVEVVRTVSS